LLFFLASFSPRLGGPGRFTPLWYHPLYRLEDVE